MSLPGEKALAGLHAEVSAEMIPLWPRYRQFSPSCSLFFQPSRTYFKEVLRQKYPLIPPRKKGAVKLGSSICSSLVLMEIIHWSWRVEIAAMGQQPQELIACNVPVHSQG